MKLASAALTLAPVWFSAHIPFAVAAHSRPAMSFASGAEKNFDVSDDSLYDAVRRRLADDAEVKGGAIVVEVKDGNVTLKGKVDNDKIRQKAARLAKRIKGVRGVSNQLTVE